eukprot:UN15838
MNSFSLFTRCRWTYWSCHWQQRRSKPIWSFTNR